MLLAAQIAVARGATDDGIELLREAAKVLPENSAELSAQAVGLLWQADRFDEAKKGFIKILREYPGYDDGRRGFAELLNRRGYRFDANQQIRFLCSRPGQQLSIDELRCLIVPTRAYQHFSEKPRINDKDWIESMGELSVARALFSEGDIRDALAVLQRGQLIKRGDPAAEATGDLTIGHDLARRDGSDDGQHLFADRSRLALEIPVNSFPSLARHCEKVYRSPRGASEPDAINAVARESPP